MNKDTSCVMVHARTRDLRVNALHVWRGERSVRSYEGWSGGGVSRGVGEQTNGYVLKPNSSGGCKEYIYGIYDDDEGLRLRWGGGSVGGDGKTELFALYVTEKNPGYCLIENPR